MYLTDISVLIFAGTSDKFICITRNITGECLGMSERPSRPSSVIGPAGKPLTITSLPPPDTKRWVISRKADVVFAVRNGLISLDEALERYSLSSEEFLDWEQLIAAHGLRGLLVTRLQEYRQSNRADVPAQKPARGGMYQDAAGG